MSAGTAGSTPFSGLVEIPPGETELTVSIPILGNRIDEPNRTFGLELSEPVGVELAAAVAQALIEDDDAPAKIDVEPIGSTARSARPGEIIALGVRVQTRGGRPIPEVEIAWHVQGVGELLDGPATTTKSDGTTLQRLQVDQSPGALTVVASDPTGEREISFLVAVAGEPGG